MKRLLGLLLSLAAAGPALAQPATELSLVPPNSIHVTHIRVGDVRADLSSAVMRRAAEKGRPGGLALLDRQFRPKPSTFDRVTVFALNEPTSTPPVANPDVKAPIQKGDPVPPAPPPAPAPNPVFEANAGVIVRTKAAFDPAEVLAAFNPAAKLDAANPKAVYPDASGQFAVTFVDEVTALFGTKTALAAALTPRDPKAAEHPVVVEARKANHAVTFGTNLPGMLPLPLGRPALNERAFLLSVDLGVEPTATGRAQFNDAAAAQAALDELKAQGKKAREYFADRRAAAEAKIVGNPAAGKELRPLNELPGAAEGLATLAVEELLASLFEAPPLARVGDTLTFEAPVHPLLARVVGPLLTYAAWSAPGYATGADAGNLSEFLPYGGGTAAFRVSTQNNLKQIGLAFHNYHDAIGFLPATAPNQARKVNLSWRVAILPYIEQGPLYEKFRLDEPWDSAHNKKVFDDNPMPELFRVVGSDDAATKKTRVQVFTGPGALFTDYTERIHLLKITDGTSNTIMVALAATPVEWTKPSDIAFNHKADPRKLLAYFGRDGKPAADGVTQVILGDGSVRALTAAKLNEANLKAAITRSGGEALPLED